MARLVGMPLMPWQQLVADVGGELDPTTGLPAYRRVVVTVPRQSGKTTLVLAWELQRALGWGGPQRIIYTAQDGAAASNKLIDDQYPILTANQKALGIKAMLRGAGHVQIKFNNGSIIEPIPTTVDAGHGKTVDLGVFDELFADKDERREQALVPAMATRAAAQLIVVSTAGTDDSVALNKLVARGRAAVERGDVKGIAYFEWSADSGADPDDVATWWSCMPALGHTQSEAVIEDARASMSDGEFRRAFLNQPTRADDRVIPVAQWDSVCSVDAKPGAPLLFALDVNPERSFASIAAASGGSIPTAELVEHRPGVGWVVERIVALCERWHSSVLVDVTGPAGFIVPELTSRGVAVQEVSSREFVASCGAFYDRVLERRVLLRASATLDEAAAGAVKRTSGDAWAWARKATTVDVSPLVAVTLAVWGSTSGLRVLTGGLVDPNEYDADDEDGWKT